MAGPAGAIGGKLFPNKAIFRVPALMFCAGDSRPLKPNRTA